MYFRDTAMPCNKREPGTGCSAITGINRLLAILGTSEHCIATNPSDMCVALAALEATIHVQGPKGTRAIAIGDFHLLPGNTPQRETVLEPGELITHVTLPPPVAGSKQVYLKLRDRSSYEFALASAAVVVKVTGGNDYVGQLKSMGAVLLFPRPEDGKQCIFYSLGNPAPAGAPADGGVAGDRLITALADRIRFSDARRDAMQGVDGAVGLDFTPRTFRAFFPKSVEDDLARLETGYRNKRADDIEETIFRVAVRGGQFSFVVDEQKMKR
jgi:hypothetical protein